MMPGLSIYSNNWPTIHQCSHNTAVPPPPELSHFIFSGTNHFSNFNNGFTTTNNNLPFQNAVKYPSLSSSYNPLLSTHQSYSNSQFISNYEYDHHEFFQGQIQDNLSMVLEAGSSPDNFPVNPMEQIQPEYYSYPMSYPMVQDVCSMEHMMYPIVPDVCSMEHMPYPMVPAVCSMEHMQSELPPLSEIYQYGGSASKHIPTCFVGHESNNINRVEERNGGERRLSAQSMAARVRRRKISEKTLELGKLVPGGHKMTTAEMFQAAYKYIKFMQAQVGVLQLMSSSKELGSELQDFVTSPSVQEKLYTEGKCIVSQTLANTIADDHQGI